MVEGRSECGREKKRERRAEREVREEEREERGIVEIPTLGEERGEAKRGKERRRRGSTSRRRGRRWGVERGRK